MHYLVIMTLLLASPAVAQDLSPKHVAAQTQTQTARPKRVEPAQSALIVVPTIVVALTVVVLVTAFTLANR